MKIHNFKQAEDYLNRFIAKGFKYIFQGEEGLKRVKKFYRRIGDPQEKIKIIHIAGTSGKSSTCYLVSKLLASHGFKVALTLSPHLFDVCERIQINNKKISKKEFVFYLNKITPFITGPLSYFEIMIGLAFYIFADKKVDYAVIETGLGGLFDSTNVISRSDKLSVITRIGLDHTNVLGKTIDKIAFQKAMIINKDSHAITIHQKPAAEKIIREVAEKKNAIISFIEKNNLKLNLIGEYQKENANLALSAVKYLSKRDGFKIKNEKVKKVFETADFSGRFDIKKIAGKEIIFDGAHNPQKMKAFIDSLAAKYPNKKFDFLVSFKEGKDYKDMLKIIVPRASSIVLTSFHTDDQDMINSSEEVGRMSQYLKKIKFINFSIGLPLETAWKNILDNKKRQIIVTGSLYLVGEIFKLIKKK
jgi:dihydrofolate synthase/folylpolyglutamate synthase